MVLAGLPGALGEGEITPIPATIQVTQYVPSLTTPTRTGQGAGQHAVAPFPAGQPVTGQLPPITQLTAGVVPAALPAATPGDGGQSPATLPGVEFAGGQPGATGSTQTLPRGEAMPSGALPEAPGALAEAPGALPEAPGVLAEAPGVLAEAPGVLPKAPAMVPGAVGIVSRASDRVAKAALTAAEESTGVPSKGDELHLAAAHAPYAGDGQTCRGHISEGQTDPARNPGQVPVAGHELRVREWAQYRPREVELNVDGGELGQLTVRVGEYHGTVTARFLVEEPGARPLLAARLPELGSRLSQAGLTAGDLGVAAGGHGGQGQWPRQTPGDHRFPPLAPVVRARGAADGTGAMAKVAAGWQSRWTGRGLWSQALDLWV